MRRPLRWFPFGLMLLSLGSLLGLPAAPRGGRRGTLGLPTPVAASARMPCSDRPPLPNTGDAQAGQVPGHDSALAALPTPFTEDAQRRAKRFLLAHLGITQ